MRPPGVLRTHDLPKMTNRELRSVLLECGPSEGSGQWTIVKSEIERRSVQSNQRNAILAIVAAIVAALIAAVAARWADFSWWITHALMLR